MSDWNPVFRNSTKLPDGSTLSISLLGYDKDNKKLVRAIAQISRKDGDVWVTVGSTACDIKRDGEKFTVTLPEKLSKTSTTVDRKGSLF